MPIRKKTTDPAIIGAKKQNAKKIRRLIKLRVSKGTIEKEKEKGKKWVEYLEGLSKHKTSKNTATAKNTYSKGSKTNGIFNSPGTTKPKKNGGIHNS